MPPFALDFKKCDNAYVLKLDGRHLPTSSPGGPEVSVYRQEAREEPKDFPHLVLLFCLLFDSSKMIVTSTKGPQLQ